MIRLFENIYDPNYYKDQAKIGKYYRVEKNMNQYNNQNVVKESVNLLRKGYLSKGEIFTIFNVKQRKEAISLFNILYFAKNWETFYNTACWIRKYFNEGIFIYVMHLAVRYRKDTQGMTLPAIYEINPFYFVNDDTIDQINDFKRKHKGEINRSTFYIYTNYSGWTFDGRRNPFYLIDSSQSSLSYFTEDVGLNLFYYYLNIENPFWMVGKDYGIDIQKNEHRLCWVSGQNTKSLQTKAF